MVRFSSDLWVASAGLIPGATNTGATSGVQYAVGEVQGVQIFIIYCVSLTSRYFLKGQLNLALWCLLVTQLTIKHSVSHLYAS